MCICGCCCKSLSLYFSLSSTSSGCCKSRYILLIFTKFSLNKSLLLGTYLMDKFFILRTLAASCVSLKKKRREKRTLHNYSNKKVMCVVHELDFEKKSYSNKMHIELQWKQIGRWFYLSVAFFLSLTHLLIHSLTLHFHSFAPSSASMFSSRLIFIHVHALMIFIFILSTSGKKIIKRVYER